MDSPADSNTDTLDPDIRCTDCEAICCRLTVVLMPDDRVPEWLIERDPHGMQTLAKNDDGWCAAVDPNTSRCTIYDQRPSICRYYAMGSPSCQEERQKWYGKPVPTRVHLV